MERLGERAFWNVCCPCACPCAKNDAFLEQCHYRHALRDGTLVKQDYVDNIAQALAEGTVGADGPS
jgi:hypothetical protein